FVNGITVVRRSGRVRGVLGALGSFLSLIASSFPSSAIPHPPRRRAGRRGPCPSRRPSGGGARPARTQASENTGTVPPRRDRLGRVPARGRRHATRRRLRSSLLLRSEERRVGKEGRARWSRGESRRKTARGGV